MKEEFMQIPAPLRKQIFIRMGFSAIAFLLFFIILFSSWDFRLCFPCLILAVFLLINDGILLYQCLSGNYIRLTGVCTGIQTTGLQKKVKAVQADIEGVLLQVRVKHRLGSVAVGDKMELYASVHTPIYEQDGVHIIYDYYAMEVKKGV